jgi:hypothetical protein
LIANSNVVVGAEILRSQITQCNVAARVVVVKRRITDGRVLFAGGVEKERGKSNGRSAC